MPPYKVRAGTNVERWSNNDVSTWIRSISIKYGLDPRTTRAVSALVLNGGMLINLHQNQLTVEWGLPVHQAKAVLKAVRDAQEQADRYEGEAAEEENENLGGGTRGE